MKASLPDEDEIPQHPLLPFEFYDAEFLDALTTTIRDLIVARFLPKQIWSLSKLLLGLQRLPLCTRGLDIELSASEKFEDECTSYVLVLTGDRFRVDSGGYVSESYGSDSFSGPSFEVEYPDYRSEESGFFWNGWLEGFRGLLKNGELRIMDSSHDESLNWEEENGWDYWQMG